MVQWLSEQGAEKDKADNNGSTPLVHAACNGHLTVVEWLLEQGADVNKADKEGWTALHYVVNFQNSKLITCLMNWGADLTAIARTNNADQLPIDIAANDAIKQLIRDEEEKRRNHGLKRAVIRPPSPVEDGDGEPNCKKPRLEGEVSGQATASATSVAEEEQDSEVSSDEDEDEK